VSSKGWDTRPLRYSAAANDVGSAQLARVEPGAPPRTKLGCIEVIPRSDFSFNAAASTTTVIPIAKRIDITGCVSGTLIARLHTKSFASSTAQTSILCDSVSYSDDEPSVLFIGSFSTSFATATVLNGDTAPKLYSIAFTKPPSNMTRVSVQHFQGINTGICTLTLSVELVLRDA
jgi:hypothetical protein